MTKLQTNKLLTLAALAVVMSMAGATGAYAAGLGAYGRPSAPVDDTVQHNRVTTSDANALHEWHDEVVKNDKMRQRMDLSGVKAEPTDEKSGLKQSQDETVKNNAMRSRMGLSQQ